MIGHGLTQTDTDKTILNKKSACVCVFLWLFWLPTNFYFRLPRTAFCLELFFTISTFRIPHSTFRIPTSPFRIPTSPFRIPTSAFYLTLSSALSPIRLTSTPTISRRYQARPRMLSLTFDSSPANRPASAKELSSTFLPVK